MYDVTEKDSFSNMTSWLKLTYDHIEKEQISIILIGNKIDKIEQRQVSTK